jgi:hypothetical protein
VSNIPIGYPPKFPRADFLKSARAVQLGIANVPTPQHELNLRELAWTILQPLRDAMGGPILVTSGYRSPELNAKTKGSSPTSQHSLGQAADIVTGGTFTNAAMFHYIRQNLPFDQMIWEYGNKKEPKWVHVSYRPNPRGKILVTTGTPDKPSYAPWKP